MSKLGIGIIGLQGYGTTYFPVIEQLKDAAVVAICDVKEDVLLNAARKYDVTAYRDYRDMLQDAAVDAVFISTPHFLHYQMTMDALNAGKHVFCEKPLAINGEEAMEMTARAEELGLTLSCHYNRRQSIAVKKMRRAVELGLIGDAYALNARWMARYTAFMFSPDSAWRIDKEKAGGGILIGRGSHMIDAALYILGHPEVEAVTANISSNLCGFEVDDYAMVLLRLKSGATIQVECSYENHIPDYSEKLEYELWGTNAGIQAIEKDGKSSFAIGCCAFPENKWIDKSVELDDCDYASVYPVSIIEDFVDAVNAHRTPLITGHQGAMVTRVLDAAYRSAREKKEIVL